MWIPVGDRLPEEGDRVIGYDRLYGRIGEAERGYSPGQLVFIDSDDCDITHWMAFPEPPVQNIQS